MDKNKNEIHLDVYLDRQELYMSDVVNTYYEGIQSAAAKQRYEKIKKTLATDFLQNKLDNLENADFTELSEENKHLLEALIAGVSSEKGRGLLGVAFLQLVIKTITPEQSVRLHKSSNQRGKFSWKDGISMRTLNSKYTGKFLKDNGLLNSNKFGSFMTRTLAENYPFSKLYKAEIRGPFKEWIAIVDAIESNDMPAEPALSYLMLLLKRNADAFKELAENAVQIADKYPDTTFENILERIKCFYNSTYGKARAFEVVMHGLMQAKAEMGAIGDWELVPLSQMRSANKKHGNVGDVELLSDEIIVEAWDAKYGKTYLLDELDELRDKLIVNPGVEVAGFVADKDVDKTDEIVDKISEIETDTSTEIVICSFDEWIKQQTEGFTNEEKNILAKKWLMAVVETFALKRSQYAPIEEPSERWLVDITKILNAEEEE